MELKHARNRVDGRTVGGQSRGIQMTSMRTSTRGFGLSGAFVNTSLSNIEKAERRRRNSLTKLVTIPEALNLKQARGTTLTNEDQDESGESSKSKTFSNRKGRFSDVVGKKDEIWMAKTHAEKMQVGREIQESKIKKEQRLYDKRTHEVGCRQVGRENLLVQREYFRELCELICQNYNNQKDLTQSAMLTPHIAIRNVENVAWGECSNVEALEKKYPFSTEMKDLMTAAEPNTLVTVVCRVFQAIYNPSESSPHLKFDEVGCSPIETKMLTAEEGDLLCVVRGEKKEGEFTIFVVSNVVLNPLICGLFHVECENTDDGWSFDFRKVLGGEYIRSNSVLVGQDRGYAAGDFWGFNVCIAKASHTRHSLKYEIRRDSMLLKDLVSKKLFTAKSQPPKPKETSSSSSNRNNSNKQVLKCVDLRRQNRTKLSWVLGGLGVDVGEGEGFGEVELGEGLGGGGGRGRTSTSRKWNWVRGKQRLGVCSMLRRLTTVQWWRCDVVSTSALGLSRTGSLTEWNIPPGFKGVSLSVVSRLRLATHGALLDGWGHDAHQHFCGARISNRRRRRE